MSKTVVVIPGDDAAPEAVLPTVAILRQLVPQVEFIKFPRGEEAIGIYGSRAQFEQALRQAIDRSHTTLFGATSGKTGGIGYLRWGKKTYANVRPAKWMPGFRSPLKNSQGIDLVIVRENLEDLYMGMEGELHTLAPLSLKSWITQEPLDTTPPGKFAVKVITEEGSRRIARFACALARQRKHKGGRGKITCTCKYNVLWETDGLFRRVVEETVGKYGELSYEQCIVDECAKRIVTSPQDFDVIVTTNLYGDILSDAAAGVIGGLGLAPSGCYGDTYAYFEPVHGSAPDISGKNIINPTATLLSAGMMLHYLGFPSAAQRLETAIYGVYARGRVLPPDQGGEATTREFCQAVQDNL